MSDGDVAPTNQQQVNQQAPQSPQPLGAQGRPGFFRSLLAQLLTGVQAGVMAPQTAEGPSDAAQLAQAIPQQRIQQQQQQLTFDTDQQLKQANLAMMHLNIQRTMLMNLKLSKDVQSETWTHNRDFAEAMMEKGKAKPIGGTGDFKSVTQKFGTLKGPDNDNGLSLAILPAPGSTMEDGQFAIYAIGNDPLDSDYHEDIHNSVGDELGVKPIPYDAKAGTDSKTAWAHRMQVGMEYDKAVGLAAAQKRIETQQTGAMARTKLSINAANWRAELHESNANARARMAQANKSTDTQYINLIKQYNQKVAQADKWAQDNKISAAIGWKDNPYSQEVDAYANIVSQYEQSHPAVVGGMKGASPTAAKPGAKIRVKIGNQTGTIDEKDFDEKTMTKVQ